MHNLNLLLRHQRNQNFLQNNEFSLKRQGHKKQGLPQIVENEGNMTTKMQGGILVGSWGGSEAKNIHVWKNQMKSKPVYILVIILYEG